MLHKLKILTLLGLSDKLKLKQGLTAQQKLGRVGKTVIGMAISYAIFTLIFYVIFKLIFFQATDNLLIFVIFVMQAISIISCSFNLSKSLYASADTNLLFTYPVKHELVYVSKLLVCFIIELLKSLFFTFPLFMAYMTINTEVISFNYIVSSLFYSIILPLFPVLLGAIIPIPFIFFKKYVLKYSVAKIILSIVFLGLLFYITYAIIGILPDNIRIVALYNRFLTGFNNFVGKVNKFTLYNYFIGKGIYGVKPWLNFLYTLLCLIGCAALSIGISFPSFFGLTSTVKENSIEKTHKPKNTAFNNTFLTFILKELKLSIRNISDFISNYLFLFLMPFVLALLTNIYIRVDRNDLGIAMTYGFIGLIALVMLASSNTASATAISSEGNEFGLLKTAPANTYNIVWSKTLVNFMISFIFLTFSFVWLSILLGGQIEQSRLWLVYFVVLIANIGLIFWSIELDILNPRLKEYESSQSRSDVNNFSKSIMIGTISSVLISVVIVAVFMFKLSLALSALILISLVLIFSAIRTYFLINYMNAYFLDIEM